MTIGISTKLGYALLLIGGIIVFAFQGLIGSIVAACFATIGYILAIAAINIAINQCNIYLSLWNSKIYGRSIMSNFKILWWVKLILVIAVYTYIMGAANFFGCWNKIVWWSLGAIFTLYTVFSSFVIKFSIPSPEDIDRIQYMLSIEKMRRMSSLH